MLLESISSFIYILFMRAGCGGDDLGLCSKVAAPSVAGGANAENLITSLRKKQPLRRQRRVAEVLNA